MNNSAIINKAHIEQLASEVGSENIPMLLNIFIEELKQYSDVIDSNTAYEQRKLECAEICHALKSNAASFGAVALCNHANCLDQEFKQGSAISDDEQFSHLQVLIRKTEIKFCEYIESLES